MKDKHFESKFKETLKKLNDIEFALNESSIVAITDNKGFINHVNDKYCETSKYERHELLGQNHRIVNS
ncbi:GGDEF domain-containing protein, partial (plasmid) [Priestia aryabhattai]